MSMSVVTGVTRTPVARSRRRVQVVVGLVLLGAPAVSVLLSLAFGSRPIPFREVLDAVFTDLDSDNATVIESQRVPRTLLGLSAGVALGMAGALMQGHTRNPLADPGLFGVNAGASFGVAVLVFTLDVTTPAALTASALIGAGVVTTLVFVLGLGGRQGGGLVMLAVVGTTLGALLAAFTTALVLLDRQTLDVMRFWEVGALSNRDLSLVPIMLPLVVLGLLLAVMNAFTLDALSLGDDVAESLGTDVRTSRVTGIVAISLLAGTATAVCGPIGFVGLVAPHLARALSGHDYRWLVPFSGLAGGALLLLADTAGRLVARPGELQAGIVLAVVGAPVLLGLTRRRRLVSL